MDDSRLYLKYVAIIFIALIITEITYLSVPVVHEEQGVIYYLKPGTSKKTFISELSNNKIIHFPWLFALFIYPQMHAQLKTGEYHFKKGTNAYNIWHQVITGKGLYYRHFTIVPGWSYKQLKEELLKTVGLKHTSAKLDDKQIMQYMGPNEFSPEGQFFPETYCYTRGVTDLVILKRAYDLMQNNLAIAWQTRSEDLPYRSQYEALIAASMIEKEAYLDRERPIIARVLINRLKKDMLLQFDPTVIYGMGDRYHGKIMKDDLLQDNPYNTYLHKGLPPTPISMPSFVSIQAALHPDQNNYLYFVAKGDGSHQFSNSLLEHHVAVTNATTQTIEKQTPNFNERFIKNYLHPHDKINPQIKNKTSSLP